MVCREPALATRRWPAIVPHVAPHVAEQSAVQRVGQSCRSSLLSPDPPKNRGFLRPGPV